jgi:predicted secreted protein
MATAGKSSTIKSSADNTTYTEIRGANTVSFSIDPDLLEDTEFGDSWKTRIQGLKDWSCTVSGDFVDADTGQGHIEANVISGTAVWVQFLIDGTNGFQGPAMAALSHDSAVADKGTFSYTITGNGALTVV